MQKDIRKITYIALIAFLLGESAVVFLHWPLAAGIFLYAIVMVSFFPTQSMKIIFPISIACSIVSAIFFLFAHDDLLHTFSLYTFLTFVLLTWSLVVLFFGVKNRNSNI